MSDMSIKCLKSTATNIQTKEVCQMSEEVFNMNFYGADELINALEKMAKEYPDAAGDLLRERGLELRRKIVLSAHENTNTKGDSKRSLGKIGSYRLSKVQGYA